MVSYVGHYWIANHM